MDKRAKYAEVVHLPNVAHTPEKWQEIAPDFKQYERVVLEAGAGRGDWLLAYAQEHPDWLFIAVETKRDRVWHGARDALAKRVQNLLFINDQAQQLAHYLPPESVDELWIQFPDPLPKPSHARRRLTASEQLRLYWTLLKPGAPLHFKTDDPNLFDFTLEALQELPWQIEAVDRAFHLHRPAESPFHRLT